MLLFIYRQRGDDTVKRIRINDQDGVTMVWFVINKVAVVAEVEKLYSGYHEIRFQGRKIMCFSGKRDAVAEAKKLLRKIEKEEK